MLGATGSQFATQTNCDNQGGFIKHILAFTCLLTVAGCSTVATPSFIDNNYYMMGDPSCVQARFLSSTRIMCLDKNGSETGYRDSMTSDQLQMHQIQLAQQQAQMQALNESMRQVGQTFQNAGQQITQQSQQYTAPQVQPINPQATYSGTTYRRIGNTWVGSNGSSCQVVGQSILCSDGSRCQLVGQNLICN